MDIAAREAQREYNRQYYAANKKKINERRKKYYVENKEEIDERHKDWVRNNPEKVKAIRERYWARKALLMEQV